MITRRHIRIKVMHHLYAQSTDLDMGAAVLLRNLDKSLDEVHDLFAWDISAFLRLNKEAQAHYERIEQRSARDQTALDRIERFTSISFFAKCEQSSALSALIEGSHVNWSNYAHHFRNLWETIYASERYEEFLTQTPTHAGDKRFLREIYQQHIAENEFIHDLYEDQHAQWSDDLDAAQMMTAKVLSSWKEEDKALIIPKLFKDESDALFGPLLIRKYFEFNGDSIRRIEEKSKNWESDRIAKMDVLLMKVCIAEWRGFDEIPVKVSLNECLDLAKEYSTPKSSSFINGVLDKIVANVREEGLINKVGRGMIE